MQFSNMVVNKGTGAGGANTNKTGLSYENKTALRTVFNIIEDKIFGKGVNDKYSTFNSNDKEYILLTKRGLKNYLSLTGEYSNTEKILEPDEVVLDEVKKDMFIFEKKFQQTSGSADEKIQTAVFKREFYEEQYPNFNINFAYILCDWFKHDRYKPEMRYLAKYNFTVFWSSDDNYGKNITDWISNS
jgi:hypothetical protein